MKLVRSLSLALVITSCSSFAWSAQPSQQDAHHPAASASTPKVLPGKASSDMSGMNTQMKAMEQMHDKMMAAKTPEERNALMAEHMKTMQDSMAMMKGMSAGTMGGMTGVQKSDMATHHQVMEKRMDMMQSMMQMMMDRMPVPAGR
ncbi:MAG: hypothetical protein HYX42_19715 [Polaromonas sp.]|uniref:hypothetical protein n=1 Tax=Polaromonas sp. TaxID=1869339 RepID=UPI0025CE876D|nr:hypothetical protein [Polaromonas sp.]MBI2728471.1 hypothetical protein [Polaromonas sp.]